MVLRVLLALYSAIVEKERGEPVMPTGFVIWSFVEEHWLIFPLHSVQQMFAECSLC